MCLFIWCSVRVPLPYGGSHNPKWLDGKNLDKVNKKENKLSIDNLIKNSDLTPQERKEKAHKAGIASGKSRRYKKHLQDSLRKLLVGDYTIKNGDIISTLQGYDAVATSMILQAISGNVKAATFIRDTIGEKPTDTLELGNNSPTGIKITFVDKSNTKKKENDPKIVGDYTPPSNTE